MRKIQRVVIWFSAGVTSAIAAKKTVEKYTGLYPISIVNCDTGSEHPDNLRFIKDCEDWLEYPIEIIKNPNYTNCQDVYHKDKWLVGPQGARCSLMMKRKVRESYQNIETDLQIFGYDASEQNRALRFRKNNPLVLCEFPLIDLGITKMKSRQILLQDGIQEPITYSLGFNNANCLHPEYGLCVKGGIGYFNHARKVFPKAFLNMAKTERELGIAICKTYVNGERIKIFLDELPKDAGNYQAEPNIICGLFCE